MAGVGSADNNINKQRKFYWLPKRYNKIRRFKQSTFVLNQRRCAGITYIQ
jgi:hypothetical protein